MQQRIDLSGQIAFITGGGRGIGRQIAKHLAQANATIVVAARTLVELDETAKVITARGGKAIPFQLDVTNSNEVDAVIKKVNSQIGSIDLLINNAGIGLDRALTWQTAPADWWRVFEVNVRGALVCTYAVLGSMVERNHGRIINIGSNAGIKSSPMISAYGASKAALLHFSCSIGEEIRGTNVCIFTFSPGLVYTDMTKNISIFKDLPDSAWTPIERVGEICAILGSGVADKLSGRYFHAREDDLYALIENAEAVIENDAQLLHLRRLNT